MLLKSCSTASQNKFLYFGTQGPGRLHLHASLTGFLFFLSNYPVASKAELKKNSVYDSAILENTTFQLECYLIDNENKKITETINWSRDPVHGSTEPDPVHITGNNDNGNITIIPGNGRITSILTVRRAPSYNVNSVFYYYCAIGSQGDSFTFPMRLFKASNIPKATIQNGSSVTAMFGETVKLVCDVSYEVTQNTKRAKLSVDWRRGSKKVKQNYVYGNPFSYVVAIKESSDGGVYTCQSKLSIGKQDFVRNASVELRITPKLIGPAEKEVKDVAGADVKLKCDIIGYPMVYKWQYEDGSIIAGNISRISIYRDVLSIEDIEYSDRKKYICVGALKNKSKIAPRQIVILRVKDPLAPLWPFIGIVVEALVVAAIIGGTEYYKCRNARKNSKTDAGDNEIEPPAETATTVLT